MAERLERDEVIYNGPVQEKEQKIDLGEFLATYLASIQQSKNAASAQINAAYDSMVQNANAQKEGIKKQADETFRGIYSNAKVSALHHNEQLAAMGLSKGNAQAPSSGYGETSRIRQDNAMRNDLNTAAMNRDSNLAAVDTKVSELNAQRAGELSALEREYGSQYLSALQQTAQMEFDYYKWQQEMDAEKQQALQEQSNWQSQFEYQKQKDEQTQSNWQSQFEEQKQQALQEQSNWQSQFDYQKQQDKQEQKNWEAEFYYQQAYDAQKRQDSLWKYLQESAKAEEAETTAQETNPVTVSQEELNKANAEERFQRYLRFAQSSASFQNDEAYASYFDQLYRQHNITYDQYYRALRAKGYSDSIIKLRIGLMGT